MRIQLRRLALVSALLLSLPALSAQAAPKSPGVLQRLLSLARLPALTATAGPQFDERPPSGGEIVVNTDTFGGIINPNDGIISLAEAIGYANADPISNRIRFDVSLNGKTISSSTRGLGILLGNGDSIVGDYGSLTSRVLVNADLRIENANSYLIRGLCLPSLWIMGGSKCKVDCCHFGLALDGKTRFPATGPIMGLEISSSSSAHPAKGNVIGGNLIAQRNYFGADSPGVGGGPFLTGEWTSENWVYNNYVGLQHDGVTPLAVTPWGGVTCAGGAHGNHLGDWPNRWNALVVAQQGVTLQDPKTTGNIVRSNYINVGRPAVHAKYGIAIQNGAHDNTIGGPMDPERLPNVIGNCDEAGILIEGGCNSNSVTSTCIGLDQWGGVIGGGGGKIGVWVGADTTGTRIGGSVGTSRNWIAGQTVEAISVGARSTDTLITGNWIGFDSDDKPASPGDGIGLHRAAAVTIGGGTPKGYGEPGNVIAGCTGHAIHLQNCTGPVSVQSNTIGMDPTRAKVVKNGGRGLLAEGSSNLYLGTQPPTATSEAPQATLRGNLFANSLVGITIRGPGTTALIAGNRVEGNSSHGVILDGGPGELKEVGLGPGPSGGVANEIVSSGGYGVVLEGAKAHDNTVAGNWIGVLRGSVAKSPDQWAARGNQRGGILVTQGAHTNRIGGANTICSNGGPGLTLTASAHHNTVVGNCLGRETPGNNVPGNAVAGLLISAGAHDNTIGTGAGLGTRNQIAGNRNCGVWITGKGTNTNQISNCYLGVSGDVAESVPDGNGNDGVRIEAGAQSNVIGTSSPNLYLVIIAANRGAGVSLAGVGTNGNRVIRCRIGTDPNGEAPGDASRWSNKGPGVEIAQGASSNLIGTINGGTGNQISNNTGPGVTIVGGDHDIHRFTQANSLTDDLIGTTADGSGPLGNGADGLSLVDAWNTMVQLSTISGNRGWGVSFQGTEYQGTLFNALNKVERCRIGTDRLGKVAVPNGLGGVLLTDGVSVNTLQSNVISGNHGDGVMVTGWPVQANRIEKNTIGLGLGADSPLANSGAGVAVRPKTPRGGPTSTTISENAIYGKYPVRLEYLTDKPDPVLGPGDGTWVHQNVIGLAPKSKGVRGTCGVLVRSCEVVIAGNTIAWQDVGAQATGNQCFIWLAENRLHDNRVHVQFADGSSGMLGDAKHQTSVFQYGENVFGPRSGILNTWAIDAQAASPARAILAQYDDWGTPSKRAIEKQIRFRAGDLGHTSVVFDPIIGGLHPKGLVAALDGAVPPTVMGLSAAGAAAGATVTFALSTPAAVTAEVTNIAGRPVRTLCRERACEAGANTLLWNALSDNGLAVPNGSYLVRVVVRGADGRQAQATTMLQFRR